MRTSSLDLDLSYSPLLGVGDLDRPHAWTSEWVKHRVVEAFTIERRIPDKRVGPAMVRNTWKLGTLDDFADKVAQGEAPREEVWAKWARAGGATAREVSRMEEALSWPGLVLSNGHAVEGKVLLAWGFCTAYGRPVRRMLRKRGWSRSTFYRYVDTGSARIADHLNKRAVAVR